MFKVRLTVRDQRVFWPPLLLAEFPRCSVVWMKVSSPFVLEPFSRVGVVVWFPLVPNASNDG